jgi:hypothetical protein
MNKQESIFELHADHQEWMSKLDFYKDDIKILTNRLAEIASKNTDKEILAEVEKFQNHFIVQNDNIDRIKHIITIDEDKLKAEVNRNPVAVDHRKMGNHDEEKDLVDTFEKNFNEIRADFNEFSAKWM